MKKFIKYFILVLSICSIFTLSVFANGAINNDTTKIYTAGAPMMLYTSSKINDQMYAFVDPNVNVYVHTNESGYTPYMSQYIGGNEHSTITYTADTAVADVSIWYTQPAILNGFAMYEPMFFDVNNYVNNDKIYQSSIGIYKPYAWVDLAPEVYLDSLKIYYNYNVAKARFDDNGNVTGYYTEIYYFEYEVPVSSDGYARFLNYYDAHINTIKKSGATWDANGQTLVWIMGVAIGFDARTATTALFIENSPSNDNTLYNDYLSYSREMELRTLNGSVNLHIDDFDFSKWLTNSVKSFMDFEIIPGLTFAGILAVLLGIPLLVWFLRLFAGG